MHKRTFLGKKQQPPILKPQINSKLVLKANKWSHDNKNSFYKHLFFCTSAQEHFRWCRSVRKEDDNQHSSEHKHFTKERRQSISGSFECIRIIQAKTKFTSFAEIDSLATWHLVFDTRVNITFTNSPCLQHPKHRNLAQDERMPSFRHQACREQ